MGERWRRFVGPRLARIVLAGAAALALAVAPPSAGTAFAAGALRVTADATYTLDPEAGRVHVAVRFQATNLKPSTPTIVYFYRELAFALQPDAKAIRASDSLGALSVSTRQRKFFTEAEVQLRSSLYYQQTATFTIRYDLVGAPPRSESPIRVGRAFAAFGVWAWGDPGRSSVEVRTPAGFRSEVEGGPLAARAASSGQVLAAEPEDPATFYAIVSSENEAAYGSTRVSIPGDVEIVVRAWPEDDAWDDAVSETLQAGLPELLELIGLPWPVEHDLDVRERYTPALEGYAGIFFTDEQRIDVSEDLDPVTIVHEASHAWFNADLFTDRWIYEGLAEEYARRAQLAAGGEAGTAAEAPDPDDPGHVTLDSWTFPQVIRDQETDDRERYGYQAAFWVMSRIVDEVGLEQMRAAFLAADANTTAYPGAGKPETVAATDSWRRLLDLVEPPDEPTSDEIDGLLRDLVLRGLDLRALTTRAEAREAYRELLAGSEDWSPPWYVRSALETWKFDLAETRIGAATEVLALRDRVAAASGSLGLAPDDALELAFEGASDGFDPALELGGEQLDALAAIGSARDQVAIEPDLVAQLGRLGETPPETPYEAARDAFQRGDLDGAVASAGAAVALVTGAAAIGQTRLLIILGVSAAVLLLLVVAVILLRRRGRRRRAAAFAAGAPGQGTVNRRRGPRA